MYYDVIRHDRSLPEHEREQVVITGLSLPEDAVRLDPTNAEHTSQLAVIYHNECNLKQATHHVQRTFELSLPRAPAEHQVQAIRRHAPICRVHATESFPLKDCVAIHHPDRPLVGYHFFWEDDYDFPDDDEPCDHEVVWVGYDPTTGLVDGVYPYWHQTILSSAAAVAKARENGGRPVIRMQWGKHGTLLVG